MRWTVVRIFPHVEENRTFVHRKKHVFSHFRFQQALNSTHILQAQCKEEGSVSPKPIGSDSVPTRARELTE